MNDIVILPKEVMEFENLDAIPLFVLSGVLLKDKQKF